VLDLNSCSARLYSTEDWCRLELLLGEWNIASSDCTGGMRDGVYCALD
jgi:hypothetical protein